MGKREGGTRLEEAKAAVGVKEEGDDKGEYIGIEMKLIVKEKVGRRPT